MIRRDDMLALSAFLHKCVHEGEQPDQDYEAMLEALYDGYLHYSQRAEDLEEDVEALKHTIRLLSGG